MPLILSQRTCPDFRVGMRQMSRVGCEIAAVYNALRLCGCGMPCGEIIRVFEENRYLMGAGRLGADPYAIGEFLSRRSVLYTRYPDFAAMCAAADGSRGRDGVFILSFWNSRRIWNGLHTVAFYTNSKDRLLHALNFHGNDLGILTMRDFSVLTDEMRFITGYRVELYGA